jgi:hypothetical protein
LSEYKLARSEEPLSIRIDINNDMAKRVCRDNLEILCSVSVSCIARQAATGVLTS